ncbi:hypothetical protein VTN77DRAFT_6007 [Rasamsonia byssochlamydoides]|uniref:uncharacterized protein n=1 Tax=Rasamsonia byssochlamydoides TaxID=89139 RepID=UPI0037430829
MSSYNGRRGPNFSQYLEDLNTIPSPYDQVQQQEPFNLDAELALFTNAEFLDFGHFGDLSMPLTYDPAEDENSRHENAGSDKNHNVNYMDLLNADFHGLPDCSTDFNSTTQMTSTFQPAPQVHNGGFNNSPSPLDKATPMASQLPAKSAATSTTPAAGPAPTQTAGTKRKSPHDAKTLDEAARLAAEEDKRRRNTAASARFRIKKKLREQALERTVKEATEKNAALEARVSQLELENQWLKNLITEKNGGDPTSEGKNEADIAQMFKKFLASQKKSEGERNSTESKSGVGTTA